jgi:hypothetical protein
MKTRHNSTSLCAATLCAWLPALVIFGTTSPASACLSDAYKNLRTYCIENTQFDRLLSMVFADDAKPRQIAVLAGVSRYPALPNSLQLPPVENDIDMLRAALVDKLGFDEVITLKNQDFSFANLRYIFENYLPDVLQANPRSRVVFAYSGHGSDFDNQGFLYFANTKTIGASSYAELVHGARYFSLLVFFYLFFLERCRLALLKVCPKRSKDTMMNSKR